MSAKKLSRQRRKQLANIAAGLCQRCPDPLATTCLCLRHAVQVREDARRRKHVKKRSRSKTYILEYTAPYQIT